MARPLQVQFSGALYHVTARGNEGKLIFRATAIAGARPGAPQPAPVCRRSGTQRVAITPVSPRRGPGSPGGRDRSAFALLRTRPDGCPEPLPAGPECAMIRT